MRFSHIQVFMNNLKAIRRTVANRLRDARLKNGLTQEEVAALTGKPQWLISRIENGTRRVDVAELLEFARIYQKDIDYFIEQEK